MKIQPKTIKVVVTLVLSFLVGAKGLSGQVLCSAPMCKEKKKRSVFFTYMSIFFDEATQKSPFFSRIFRRLRGYKGKCSALPHPRESTQNQDAH